MANYSHDLSCGPFTIKYLVFFFNLIFFLCGIAIVIVGAIFRAYFKNDMTLFEGEYLNPSSAVILLGVAIMMFSFFGCCGSSMENITMLRIYAVFLGLLLICQLAGEIAIFVMRSDVESIVLKQLNETISLYDGNNSAITQSWDNIQKEMYCCGFNNYTDWQETKWSQTHGSSLPDSCCIKENSTCGQGIFKGPIPNNTIYTNGCVPYIKAGFDLNLASIIAVMAIVAVTEIIGLCMICSLIRGVKERYEVL